MLLKDVWFKVRREPNLVTNPNSKEKPTVWIDFYYKKAWKESRIATSAMLTFLGVQKEIGMALFLSSGD